MSLGKKHKKTHNYYYSSESSAEEAIRMLRTNILFTGIDKQVKTIVLTSAEPNVGKSTLSWWLAKSFAEDNKTVLLIDCDLRNPSIKKFSKKNKNVGLMNILANDISINDVMFKCYNNLEFYAINTGPKPPNPAEVLGSEKMKQFMELIKEDFDYIIIDTSPVGLTTDAAIISTYTDGTLLVCTQNKTEKSELLKAKNKLEKVNANILGVVINIVKNSKQNYGYYGDGN